jgi:Zn-dependent peptidase ImmA (M78 family)
VEVWCNRVAAELLVPLADLKAELGTTDPAKAIAQLARAFKVSTLVILRRLLDAGELSRPAFEKAYGAELARLTPKEDKASGGNFYLTQGVRLSKRFARALIVSTLEGQTLYRDAFQMLGINKEKTFRQLGRTLEVVP